MSETRNSLARLLDRFTAPPVSSTPVAHATMVERPAVVVPLRPPPPKPRRPRRPKIRPEDRAWLSPDEYAREYGLCLKTVYRLIRRNQLDAVRIGQSLRVARPK